MWKINKKKDKKKISRNTKRYKEDKKALESDEKILNSARLRFQYYEV